MVILSGMAYLIIGLVFAELANLSGSARCELRGVWLPEWSAELRSDSTFGTGIFEFANCPVLRP